MRNNLDFGTGKRIGVLAVLLAVLVLTVAFAALAEESEASGRVYAGGRPDSSASNPYTGIDVDDYDIPLYLGRGLYIAVGSAVKISFTDRPADDIVYDSVWISEPGFGLVVNSHKPYIVSGTLSKVGECTIFSRIGGDTASFALHVVSAGGGGGGLQPVVISSEGGATAVVGTEYIYDVQTIPEDAAVEVSGVDWLSVAGHRISGTPAAAGSFALHIVASKAGFVSAVQDVALVVSAAPAEAPVIDSLSFEIDSSDSRRVTFTAQVRNAASVFFDFGDGFQGTGLSVVHRYASAGTFVVVATAGTAHDAVTKMITVVIDGGGDGGKDALMEAVDGILLYALIAAAVFFAFAWILSGKRGRRRWRWISLCFLILLGGPRFSRTAVRLFFFSRPTFSSLSWFGVCPRGDVSVLGGVDMGFFSRFFSRGFRLAKPVKPSFRFNWTKEWTANGVRNVVTRTVSSGAAVGRRVARGAGAAGRSALTFGNAVKGGILAGIAWIVSRWADFNGRIESVLGLPEGTGSYVSTVLFVIVFAALVAFVYSKVQALSRTGFRVSRKSGRRRRRWFPSRFWPRLLSRLPSWRASPASPRPMALLLRP